MNALFYLQKANDFSEALPLGNGHIGAFVYEDIMKATGIVRRIDYCVIGLKERSLKRIFVKSWGGIPVNPALLLCFEAF